MPTAMVLSDIAAPRGQFSIEKAGGMERGSRPAGAEMGQRCARLMRSDSAPRTMQRRDARQVDDFLSLHVQVVLAHHTCSWRLGTHAYALCVCVINNSMYHIYNTLVIHILCHFAYMFDM